MKNLNVLDTIRPETVLAVYLLPDEDNKPCFNVVLPDETIRVDLTDSFGIYFCNEFLRSLNLMNSDRIKFQSFDSYKRKIAACNKLLEIRHLMEEVTGEEYNSVGLMAYQVFSCILDVLLAKHHFAHMGWNAAMQIRPLKDWVQEAIEYLK